MKTSNETIINEYIQSRGLKKSTHYTYQSILEHYSEYQKLPLNKLIEEADTEEENKIRWKNRKLKKRLINYMNYLTENMTITSAKTYLNGIKSFYHHHEIEIGKLPRFNLKNYTLNEPINYTDLPDKIIIREAVNMSGPLMRSLILFLVSAGMSKIDALNLTIQDFITATKQYHTSENITEVLNELKDKSNIIPVFKKRRSKTNKYFITFCSPETVTEICNYLNERQKKKPLKNTDKLFNISKVWYTIQFELINDSLHLGKKGAYNRFRGHMLRKFHASNLEKHGMNRYMINLMQGKSNGAVDDVYFFIDENILKEEYIKAIDGILILSEVKPVNQYSEEYKELLKENELLKEQNHKLELIENEVNDLKSWYKFG